MAEIIDLDELVPDDLEFHYQGSSYRMPGDPPLETLFELLKVFNRMTKADSEQNPEEQEQLVDAAKQILLGLFQQRDPKLKALPFGVIGTQKVVEQMFTRVGITARPPTNRKTRRTAPASR